MSASDDPSRSKQTTWCAQVGPDVVLRVKAVPGASRDAIAGLLGDRLKIRVAAPPEGGKANEAICTLIAKRLALGKRDVTIESGASSPEKSIRACGVAIENAIALLLGSPARRS